MEAKEKAKELVAKFMQYAPLEEIKYYSVINMAKGCAKIAVNEIIKVLDSEQIELQAQERMKCNLNFRYQEYYKSVLKEIDNI